MAAVACQTAGRVGPASALRTHWRHCGQPAGPSHFDGANDDFGGNLQAQARRIEHHVELMRVIGVGTVHGAIELRAAAIEIACGSSRGSDRNSHSLCQSLRSYLERRDHSQRQRRFTWEHETSASADEDRFARATDRLNQFGQMVEICLLRSVVFLAKRQEPILHHAGRCSSSARTSSIGTCIRWAIAATNSSS